MICCETFTGLPDTLRTAAVLLSEKKRSAVQTQLSEDSICYLLSSDHLFYKGAWHHVPSHGVAHIFLATMLFTYPMVIQHKPFRLSINVRHAVFDRQAEVMKSIEETLEDCYFPFTQEPMFGTTFEDGHIVIFLRVMHGLMGLRKKSACVVFQADRSSISVEDRVLSLPAQYMQQVVNQFTF